MNLCKPAVKSVKNTYIEHIMNCTLCSEAEAIKLYAAAVHLVSISESNLQYAVAMVICKNI